MEENSPRYSPFHFATKDSCEPWLSGAINNKEATSSDDNDTSRLQNRNLLNPDPDYADENVVFAYF
jgi:hypothetical protein